MNRDFILAMAAGAGCPAAVNDKIQSMTMARELWGIIPSDRQQAFCRVLVSHCRTHCAPLLPDGSLRIILLTDDGEPIG